MSVAETTVIFAKLEALKDIKYVNKFSYEQFALEFNKILEKSINCEASLHDADKSV